MTIYTPRGLKVRLSISWAFGLMARLYPKIQAIEVLKTTEAIENIPPTLSLIGFAISIVFRWPPEILFCVLLGSHVIGHIMNSRGIYFLPGLIQIAKVYSVTTGYGIIFIASVIAVYFTLSWKGLIVFIVSKTLNYLLTLSFEHTFVKKTNGNFTTSERHFFNSYRIHAESIGETVDITLREGEDDRDQWRESFLDLANDWPELVSRFE